MKLNSKHIIIYIICFLLAFIVTVQVRTVSVNNGDILRLKKENELRDEINQWKDAYNNLSAKNADLNKRIDEYRNASLESSDDGALIKEELDEANIVAGLIPVKGKGIKITIDVEKAIEDIALDAGRYDSSVTLIFDTDIMAIINELTMYGAEAICVNNQRITNLTSIKGDGPIIKINGVNTTAPFTIEAIGDPDALATNITLNNSKIAELRSLKIDVTITEDELELHGYEGIVDLKFATPLAEGGE